MIKLNYFKTEKYFIPFDKVVYVSYHPKLFNNPKFIRVFLSDHLQVEFNGDEMIAFENSYILWLERIYEMQIDREIQFDRIIKALERRQD